MKKTVAIAAAAGALAAISVPAMALENEFHGMYKFMGYQSNFFNGASATLGKDAGSGFMAEQRARLQYTAKANADLKLVTHFELDTRFGGKNETYLGAGNDSGNLDADQLTLETKNIYLDVNCPLTGANVKVGMQPIADSYQSLFILADMTGALASKSFGPATAAVGWFRLNDDTATGVAAVGKQTTDLIILDGKYALNKDMKVGASYYNVQDDSAVTGYELMHMIGVNADLNVGPANIKPFAAFQFGDINSKDTMSGMLLGATSKTKVGPGAVNLSAVYMSGDETNGAAGGEKSFRAAVKGGGTTYFNAANMWLLVRSGQAINSSHSILGNDLTAKGLGLMGVFGGYEATMGKLFYNANIGYAQTDKGTDKGIGTELNAQVGYKVYDNLTASGAVAYAILGDKFDASKADDPYAVNLQLSYTF
ncbi:MAG: porin [Geobacteraceae bacterium GWC2_53_11]|nr:MAG: porin [Geobacteraceae bacterium GWC2_53_11]